MNIFVCVCAALGIKPIFYSKDFFSEPNDPTRVTGNLETREIPGSKNIYTAAKFPSSS